MSLRHALSTLIGILAAVAGSITIVLGIFFTAGVDFASSSSAAARAAGPYVFAMGVLWALPNALLVRIRWLALVVYLCITGMLTLKLLEPIPTTPDFAVGFQGYLAVAIIITISYLPWVSLLLRHRSPPSPKVQSAV
jgi:hypothetical protein